MKRIKFTTLGGEKKTVLIRDDQWESIQELLVTQPELTMSGIINASLDFYRLERASKRFPFDLYEVTGDVAPVPLMIVSGAPPIALSVLSLRLVDEHVDAFSDYRGLIKFRVLLHKSFHRGDLVFP